MPDNTWLKIPCFVNTDVNCPLNSEDTCLWHSKKESCLAFQLNQSEPSSSCSGVVRRHDLHTYGDTKGISLTETEMLPACSSLEVSGWLA